MSRAVNVIIMKTQSKGYDPEGWNVYHARIQQEKIYLSLKIESISGSSGSVTRQLCTLEIHCNSDWIHILGS